MADNRLPLDTPTFTPVALPVADATALRDALTEAISKPTKDHAVVIMRTETASKFLDMLANGLLDQLSTTRVTSLPTPLAPIQQPSQQPKTE